MSNSENSIPNYYSDGDDGWDGLADESAEIRNKTIEVEEAIAEAEELIGHFDPSSDEDNAEVIKVREQLEDLKNSNFYESIEYTLQRKIDELIDDLTKIDSTDPINDEE